MIKESSASHKERKPSRCSRREELNQSCEQMKVNEPRGHTLFRPGSSLGMESYFLLTLGVTEGTFLSSTFSTEDIKFLLPHKSTMGNGGSYRIIYHHHHPPNSRPPPPPLIPPPLAVFAKSNSIKEDKRCSVAGSTDLRETHQNITGGSRHQYHFCRDKHVFVTTKRIFCRDKCMHVATKLLTLVAAPANNSKTT